jgi:predicted transcriptional regulator of viral defense system
LVVSSTEPSSALSEREARALAAWERQRKRFVTFKEIEATLGDAARWFVHRLATKGHLERIGKGIYVIHPLRSLGRRPATTSVVAADVLLSHQQHYFGGWWALSAHRLTQQLHGAVVDAFVLKPRKPRALGNAQLRFHKVHPDAFDYGLTSLIIEERPIALSDPERTLVDALDFPQVFGGMRSSLEVVDSALKQIETSRLVSWAIRGASAATCQRLGVILERRRASPRDVRRLRTRMPRTQSLLSLIPGEPRVGRLNPTWSVVENDR